jgi:hypothetical protein
LPDARQSHWAFNAGRSEAATQKKTLHGGKTEMSVCQSFSFILHRSSSEATFYHTLPGPPFSQWTALSDGLYDVLLFFITVVFDWIALFA